MCLQVQYVGQLKSSHASPSKEWLRLHCSKFLVQNFASFESIFGKRKLIIISIIIIIGGGGFHHAPRPVWSIVRPPCNILPVSIPYRYWCVPSAPTQPASMMLPPSTRGVRNYCWVGNVLQFGSEVSLRHEVLLHAVKLWHGTHEFFRP
jgi:hypothetical protein